MDPQERSRLMEQGIDRCRSGQWDQGLEALADAFEEGIPEDRHTAVASSYLGYALARKGRGQEGLKLCESAVRRGFFQPETLLNLARTQLLLGNRKAAVRAVDRGLGLAPDHGALRALRDQMGERSPAVLPFLSRDNPLNRLFGRWRHRMRGGSQTGGKR